MLASVAEQAGLCLNWSQIPKTDILDSSDHVVLVSGAVVHCLASFEPHREKTCLRGVATRLDPNQAAQIQKLASVLRSWSDCVDVQADLRLYFLHMA